MEWPPQNTGIFDPAKCECCEELNCCAARKISVSPTAPLLFTASTSAPTGVLNFSATADFSPSYLSSGIYSFSLDLSFSVGTVVTVMDTLLLSGTTFNHTIAVFDPNGSPVTPTSYTEYGGLIELVFTASESGCYRIVITHEAFGDANISAMSDEGTVTATDGDFTCASFPSYGFDTGGGPGGGPGGGGPPM
jgi:hypothetical protein